MIDLTQVLIMNTSALHTFTLQDIAPMANRAVATDQELYEAMRAGDDLCLRTLMERHRGMAHAVCRNILGDEVEADDVVQEVFFSLWKRGGWTPGDVRFTTWLHRVLINRSIDHRRRRRDTPTEADALSNAVEDFGVPFHHVPVTKQNKAEAEAQILDLISGQDDLLVLARYMQILSGDFVARYPNGCPVAFLCWVHVLG